MSILCGLLNAYVLLIFVRIILSWFPINPEGIVATIHGFLHLVTEPVLGPLRRALPPVRLGNAGLDLSPIVVLIGIMVIQGLIDC